MDYSQTLRLSELSRQMDLFEALLLRVFDQPSLESVAAEADTICSLCELLQVTAEEGDLPDGFRERLTHVRGFVSRIADIDS